MQRLTDKPEFAVIFHAVIQINISLGDDTRGEEGWIDLRNVVCGLERTKTASSIPY